MEIVHAPATQIPEDSDIVVCHTGLAGAAKNEMAALANFLDFKIDIDGMHGIEATYENINQYYNRVL